MRSLFYKVLDAICQLLPWALQRSPQTLTHSVPANADNIARTPRWMRRIAIPLGFSPDVVTGQLILLEEMLTRHALLLGVTGSGKTVFAEMLFFFLVVLAIRGGAFLDPKGDAIENLLAKTYKHIAQTGCDAILKRIHVLELRLDSVFGLDFFSYTEEAGIPESLRAAAYTSWLYRRVDSVIETIARIEGETEDGKVRLRRVLRTVLFAVGTAVDALGMHLPLSETIVLLDIYHPRHDEVFSRVAPHLPSDIASDFQMIRSMKNRPQDFLGQAESSLNRIRNLLSPLMRAVCSATVKSFDIREAIKKHHCLLVNLQETRYVSAKQASVLGGMIIHEIKEAASTMPRKERRRFYLFIDECQEHMGTDIEQILRMGRAWMLSTVLISQNMAGFRKSEDLDFTETVLSEPQTKVIFNQQVFNQALVENLAYPNLDFTRHSVEVDRHDGYDFIATPSVGRSVSYQTSTQRGGSITAQTSVTRSNGRTLTSSAGISVASADSQSNQLSIQNAQGSQFELKRGKQDSVSRNASIELTDTDSYGYDVAESEGQDQSSSQSTTEANSSDRTDSRSDTQNRSYRQTSGTNLSVSDSAGSELRYTTGSDLSTDNSSATSSSHREGTSTSTGDSSSVTDRHDITRRHSRGKSKARGIGRGSSNATSYQSGYALATNSTSTEGITLGAGKTRTVQENDQRAVSLSANVGRTTGSSKGESWGTTHGITTGHNESLRVTPLARIRTEVQVQPTLKTSVDDQLHQLRQVLCTLPNAHCLIRLYGVTKTMRLQVRHVDEPYVGDEFYAVVEEMRKRIAALHSYNFVPDISQQAEDDRIDAYLSGQSTSESQPSSGGAFEI